MSQQNSIQSILKRRQQGEFVGRDTELGAFQTNLSLPSLDDRRRFLVNVYGQGGVGKSWLLRRYQQALKNTQGLNVYLDETEKDVLEVMAGIAEQLRQQGHPLTSFDEMYKTYRRLRHELESDPELPSQFSVFLGRTLVKAGVKIGRRVPAAGVVLDFVDGDEIATHAVEILSWISKKIKNKDEIQLVREPINVLTPLLLRDLRKIGSDRSIGLFFDDYEYTVKYVDPWIRQVLDAGLENDAEALSANILVVIAGRQELDRNTWVQYEPIIMRIPLEPFSEDKAREYLSCKGITDPHMCDVILRLSGNLPLLLATLANESPSDPTQVGDPSGTAVERFLKWIDDQGLRQVAIDSALPRFVNQDVVDVVVPGQSSGEKFDWLRSMPFVEPRRNAWGYHNVVRTQMIRRKLHESPQGFKDIHAKLAKYYATSRGSSDLTTIVGNRTDDLDRQTETLEMLYHLLCSAPFQYTQSALEGFISVLSFHSAYATQWAIAMLQAGSDSNVILWKEWGGILLKGVNAYQAHDYNGSIEMFTVLLDKGKLGPHARTNVLERRSHMYFLSERPKEALADINAAIKSGLSQAWKLLFRGVVYSYLDQFDEAIADFNMALALNQSPRFVSVVHANLGAALVETKCHLEAIEHLEKALEYEQDAASLVWKGRALRSLDRYEESLSDYDKALALDPESHSIYECRGELFLSLKRYSDALTSLTEAKRIKPNCIFTIRLRAESLRAIGSESKALDEIGEIAALSPDDKDSAMRKAQVLAEWELYDEAIQAYQRAMEIDPETEHVAFKQIGIILQKQGRLAEAAAAFEAALTAEVECGHCWSALAATYKQLYQSSQIYVEMKRVAASGSQTSRLRKLQADALFKIGLAEDTLNLLDSVLSNDRQDSEALYLRSEIYISLRQFDKAATDLEHLQRVNSALTTRDLGVMLNYAGQFERAIKEFRTTLQRTPDSLSTHYNLAIAYVLARGLDQAANEIREARLALETARTNEDDRAASTYGLAGLDAVCGNTESAFALLDEAVQLDKDILQWVVDDPAWGALRTDARLRTIISSELGTPEADSST